MTLEIIHNMQGIIYNMESLKFIAYERFASIITETFIIWKAVSENTLNSSKSRKNHAYNVKKTVLYSLALKYIKDIIYWCEILCLGN